MMGVPLYVLLPIAFYLAGFLVMAEIIMPWIRRNAVRRAQDWHIPPGQADALATGAKSDNYFVAVVWPILAVMFVGLKIVGLFGHKHG